MIVRPFKFDQDALVIFLTCEQVKAGKLPVNHEAILLELRKAADAAGFEGNKGQQFAAVCGNKVVVFAGLGKEKDLSGTALRVAVRRALMAHALRRASSVELLPHVEAANNVVALIEGTIIGSYAWKKYISRKKDDTSVDKKEYFVAATPEPIYTRTAIIAGNVNFARDLVNENADVTHSLYLEKVVRGIVKGKKHVTLEVLDRNKLEKKGFGLLLAVNRGSNKEPRVLIATYTGAGAKEPYTAVVGKGLTYDTGGLNLKPTGHMETMRCDMSGAAAVIASLKNALEIGLKRNVVFACGIAENAIDANAYKPGDVFTGYSGKTVEIGNTDAEGRLVLADVLAYLVKEYKPARIVDLATLTGAVVVALGNDYTGLVSNNAELADQVLSSARDTDDRAWQLPSYPELAEAIKSKIADIRNTSVWRGAGGTITGAEFLRQFVGETPWAHLDIAGTAFVDGDGRMYFGHGATGAGVRLVADLLINN